MSAEFQVGVKAWLVAKRSRNDPPLELTGNLAWSRNVFRDHVVYQDENGDPVDWEEASAEILSASRGVLDRQRERLVGTNGQIARDIEAMPRQEGVDADTSILQVLLSLTQGARTVFDQRTHRQAEPACPPDGGKPGDCSAEWRFNCPVHD